ncbi:MAG: RsmF rRNA methyltransferase first C-terminal domain-containing protein [Lachnospiraceae bacterium]
MQETINLPEAFCSRMKLLLKEEYDRFFKSYETETVRALRVNTLKTTPQEFEEKQIFSLKKVPWTKAGFYYPSKERPGLHPYHEMGLYYIQEPSAMAVAEAAEVQPNERVLDLCAAPGGKSTQLAAALQGQGLLVSNEIHPARAKILSQNIERMGIRNAVVTNETPQKLAEFFCDFFDCIVVDAPCSGEGMFKKEEQAAIQWSTQNVELCAERQKEILDAAVTMLRPGGRLIYSTCTFAPQENEGSVNYLLETYPEFEVQKMDIQKFFSPGRPEWVDGPEELKKTARLWPHQIKGEGHYVAVLKKAGETPSVAFSQKLPKVEEAAVQLYREFEKEVLKEKLEGIPVLFGEQLYLMPEVLPLKGIKILRAGLHLGTVKKKRFEPSHALALALKKEQVQNVCELEVADERVESYLRGNAIACEAVKGWNLLCVDGYPIGWGKYSNGVLKNHYPKGLRRV